MHAYEDSTKDQLDALSYRIRLNFCRVKLSWITDFSNFFAFILLRMQGLSL